MLSNITDFKPFIIKKVFISTSHNPMNAITNGFALGINKGEYAAFYTNNNIKKHYFLENWGGADSASVVGEYKEYHKNGQLKIHTFQNDDRKICRFYKEWDKNGQLIEYDVWSGNSEEHNGVECKKWFSNRQLWIHQFAIDEYDLSGLFKEWNENGQLINDGEFIHKGYKWIDHLNNNKKTKDFPKSLFANTFQYSVG
jgi:antitoxin component YwqK of YwqJK toxin-antitoxin module